MDGVPIADSAQVSAPRKARQEQPETAIVQLLQAERHEQLGLLRSYPYRAFGERLTIHLCSIMHFRPVPSVQQRTEDENSNRSSLEMVMTCPP